MTQTDSMGDIFVSTLVFHNDLASVALVKKNRPDWLVGKWTAIGGHVEPKENIWRAAVREVEEESGLILTKEAGLIRGELVAIVDWKKGPCYFFSAIHTDIQTIKTRTDEEIKLFATSDILRNIGGPYSYDMRWLTAMSLSALQRPENTPPATYRVQPITNLCFSAESLDILIPQ